MMKKAALCIGLLASAFSSYAVVDTNSCVYAQARAEITSNGEAQLATFKGVICGDKMLNLHTASGATFTGVLTYVADEGVYINFSGIKKTDVDAQEAKEFFLAWDHEYTLTFTDTQTGDELTLVMIVSQQ